LSYGGTLVVGAYGEGTLDIEKGSTVAATTGASGTIEIAAQTGITGSVMVAGAMRHDQYSLKKGRASAADR
jgi:hypothetical protein